jgi:serine-type D-Ala-D-Ala carboxypeptidase/endopeptidase (penicillin-binding protein 4)
MIFFRITLWALFVPLSLIAREFVGIYALDRRTGDVVIDEHGEVGMTPASCIKVLTTGAALHLLGEEHRFMTLLEHDGKINEGVLDGNLYIRGGGDPCLGAQDWEEQLLIWGTAVKELGVKEIRGRVVSDASAWETALAAPGWSWDDLGNYYGSGASALSFHENCYTLTLKPSEPGGAVFIGSTFPPQFDLDLRNELVTGPIGSGDQACIYGSELSSLQFVRGSIPAAVETFTIRGAIPDPARYVEKIFTQTLEKLGVIIAGKNLDEGDRSAFHITKSPTVAEIVQATNQRSMNLYAEHLLKAMGKGSTHLGAQAVKSFWQSMGVDLSDAQITDGSGLSRNNILSAKQCVAVLRTLERSPHFVTLLSSLPEIHGMKVKSGTMSLINGYIGYSEKTVFAFFIGQCPDAKKKKSIAEACFHKIHAFDL